MTRPDHLTTATKADVRRLRSLLRDRNARDAEGVFVCEGPRVVAAAIDAGVQLAECFVGAGAPGEVRSIAERSGAPVRVLEQRLGDTVTPQPLLALAPLVRRDVEALAGTDLVLVAEAVNDPGNAGTLVRSAAAAGAQAIAFGTGSVDAYNPKVVRASAGACFAIRIVEAVAAVDVLEMLGATGVRRFGAAASGGTPPEDCDFTQPSALVVGHETRGLEPSTPVDERVTIPMFGTESLNVAMAGTVLLFEAARQRRSA